MKKHIVKEGSREHVISYHLVNGESKQVCSEKDCEINHETKDDCEPENPKMGPFLCEWCSKPMKSLKGRREENGKHFGLGTCVDCGTVWSQPVDDPLQVTKEN